MRLYMFRLRCEQRNILHVYDTLGILIQLKKNSYKDCETIFVKADDIDKFPVHCLIDEVGTM